MSTIRFTTISLVLQLTTHGCTCGRNTFISETGTKVNCLLRSKTLKKLMIPKIDIQMIFII